MSMSRTLQPDGFGDESLRPPTNSGVPGLMAAVAAVGLMSGFFWWKSAEGRPAPSYTDSTPARTVAPASRQESSRPPAPPPAVQGPAKPPQQKKATAKMAGAPTGCERTC